MPGLINCHLHLGTNAPHLLLDATKADYFGANFYAYPCRGAVRRMRVPVLEQTSSSCTGCGRRFAAGRRPSWTLVRATRCARQFMAYDVRFLGGVNITCGDLDGDGRAELITGPDAGGGPHVKIWKFDISDNRFVLVNQYMAFDPTFRGGVNVSSGRGTVRRSRSGRCSTPNFRPWMADHLVVILTWFLTIRPIRFQGLTWVSRSSAVLFSSEAVPTLPILPICR